MGCTALVGEPRLSPRLPKTREEVALELQLESKPPNLLWSAEQLVLAESTGYRTLIKTGPTRAVSHQPRDHHGQSRGGAWWGLDLLPIFNASTRSAFQKAPDWGWLCKPSIFSKYSCETARDNNLQCKVRGFHKNSE